MSLTKIDFANIKVETPTLESVKAEYQSINTALDTAKTRAQLEQALHKWENLRRLLESWSELTSFFKALKVVLTNNNPYSLAPHSQSDRVFLANFKYGLLL